MWAVDNLQSNQKLTRHCSQPSWWSIFSLFEALLWSRELKSVVSKVLNVCVFLCSKACVEQQVKRAAAKRAKSPSRGWKSWNTISTFLQIRSRSMTCPWTRLTPASFNSSNSSYSSKSSANSSSTTIRAAHLQHSSESMHLALNSITLGLVWTSQLLFVCNTWHFLP